MADMVDQPYEHDVQTNGTPMVPSSSNAKQGVVPIGNPDGTRLDSTQMAGEDIPNDVQKVEQRFNGTRVTADALVKSGVGFLHAIVVTQPAAAVPTAGVLTVYDNTTENGTVLFQHYFPASAVANPVTIPLNISFSVGCYVGFDATLAGLAFNVAHR